MVLKFLLTICFVLNICFATAQTAEEYVAQGEQLEKQMHEAEALAKYKAAISLQPVNLKALCRASILSAREGARQSSKSTKQDYFNTAKMYADSALHQAPDSVGPNYAMAVAMQQLSSIAGAKEKVADAKEVKKYTDIVIRLDSGYARAWYILGKWNYGIADLSMVEKAAAKMLFGGMPKASLQDAIACFERCRRLERGFILNYYDLANAYHKNGQDDKAIDVLKQAIALRPVMQDDATYREWCRKMLHDLQ